MNSKSGLGPLGNGDSVCLLKYVNSELLGRVFSFLWFDDHAIVGSVSSAFRDAIRSENFLKLMLQRFLGQLNRPAGNLQLSTNARIDLLIRRVSSWPTTVDTAALGHPQGPRNVSVIPADINAGDVCVVYNGGRKENRHKAYAVAVTDDHFPCLPGTFTQPRFKNEVKMQVWVRPCKEAAHKAESQRSIARTMAPFTRLIQADEYRQIATLSCIAYYECVFHFSGAMTPTATKEDPTGGQQLSIGLACALFPLRKRRPGFDNNSFGYHSDGRFYHGSRNFLQMGPTFKIGDIIGCGIIYPPLGKHCGKIFFTKNGGLVTMLDIGVGGLLGLPWFPVVGLAPGVPTQLNFGARRPFAFDVLTFEAQQLGEALGSRAEAAAAASGGDPWNFYTTLALEQEAAQWAPRHPKYRHIDWEPVASSAAAAATATAGAAGAAGAVTAAGGIAAPVGPSGLLSLSNQTSLSSTGSSHAPPSSGALTPPSGLAAASASSSVSASANVGTLTSSYERNASTGATTSLLSVGNIGSTALSSSSAGSSPSRSGFGTSGAVSHVPSSSTSSSPGLVSSSVPILNISRPLSTINSVMDGGGASSSAGASGGRGRNSSSNSSVGSLGSGSKEHEARYALLAARVGDDGSYISYTGSAPSPTPSSASGSHGSVKGSVLGSGSAPHHQHTNSGSSRGKRPAPDSSGSEHGGFVGGRYGSSHSRAGRGFRAGSDYVPFPGTPTHIVRDPSPLSTSSKVSILATPVTSSIMRPATGPASSGSGGSIIGCPTPRQASETGGKDNDKDRTLIATSSSLLAKEKIKRKRRSLFLDPDLRAATLLEITNTSRVVFGGSDASWEGTGEEDSEEEEDDEEELASTCGQGGGSQDEDWAYRAVRQISPRGVGGVGGVHPIAYPTLQKDELADGYGGLYRQEAVTTLAGLGAAGAAWSITPAEEREREREREHEEEREGWCADSMAVEWSSGEESVAAAGERDMLKKGSSPAGGSDLLPGHYEGSFTELYAEEEEEGEDNENQSQRQSNSGELSMAEFMALSDVAATGGGWLQLQHVAGGPAGMLLGVGAVGDGVADGTGDSDDRSIATSLFVEVASVDECGSYVGYGGASESEEEEDEDEEIDSRRSSRNGNLLGRPIGWGVDSTSEMFERSDKLGMASSRRGGIGLLGLLGGYYPHRARYAWDPDGDGYDGASERGRCETDGVDDLGTDGDVGEELEERDDQHQRDGENGNSGENGRDDGHRSGGNSGLGGDGGSSNTGSKGDRLGGNGNDNGSLGSAPTEDHHHHHPKLKIRRLSSSPHSSPLLSIASSTHGGSKAPSVSSSRGGTASASRASPSLHSQDGSVSGGGIPSRVPQHHGHSHHGRTYAAHGRDGQSHARYRHHRSFHRRRNFDAAALAEDVGTAHHPSNPLQRDSSPARSGAQRNAAQAPLRQSYPAQQYR